MCNGNVVTHIKKIDECITKTQIDPMDMSSFVIDPVEPKYDLVKAFMPNGEANPIIDKRILHDALCVPNESMEKFLYVFLCTMNGRQKCQAVLHMDWLSFDVDSGTPNIDAFIEAACVESEHKSFYITFCIRSIQKCPSFMCSLLKRGTYFLLMPRSVPNGIHTYVIRESQYNDQYSDERLVLYCKPRKESPGPSCIVQYVNAAIKGESEPNVHNRSWVQTRMHISFGATSEHISVIFDPPIITFICGPCNATLEICIPLSNGKFLELKRDLVRCRKLYYNGHSDWEWNRDCATLSGADVAGLSSFTINPNIQGNKYYTMYTDERSALTSFITSVYDRQQAASKLIAKYWCRCISDPSYKICQSRLKREYVENICEI